jgi:hypothetical protein
VSVLIVRAASGQSSRFQASLLFDDCRTIGRLGKRERRAAKRAPATTRICGDICCSSTTKFEVAKVSSKVLIRPTTLSRRHAVAEGVEPLS